MKLDDLPTNFTPIKEMKLGSNKLLNVVAILSVHENIPLLIGEGEPARIWLYVPANKEGSEWFPLIKDNFPAHPDVKIKTAKKLITVKIPEGTVLSATRGSNNKLVIHRLDLRPFGLDVYADEHGLNVMGNRLSSNEFNGVKVVVGID